MEQYNRMWRLTWDARRRTSRGAGSLDLRGLLSELVGDGCKVEAHIPREPRDRGLYPRHGVILRLAGSVHRRDGRLHRLDGAGDRRDGVRKAVDLVPEIVQVERLPRGAVKGKVPASEVDRVALGPDRGLRPSGWQSQSGYYQIVGR